MTGNEVLPFKYIKAHKAELEHVIGDSITLWSLVHVLQGTNALD